MSTSTETTSITSPATSKKTKARNSSSSLAKMSEAITTLDTQLKSLGLDDEKLADAFNYISAAIAEISNHLQNEDTLKRESEDEKDDQKQKSMKGKFIITSPKNGVDLVGKADTYKNEDEVVETVINFAKDKYKVDIPENEISTCYALKKGGIVLGFWNFGRGSAFQKLVSAIKSNKDVNKNMNVYFNYMLTKKRNNLLYKVRELKRKEGAKIKKFFTDENGTISVLTENGVKERITFSLESRRTISEEELVRKFQ